MPKWSAIDQIRVIRIATRAAVHSLMSSGGDPEEMSDAVSRGHALLDAVMADVRSQGEAGAIEALSGARNELDALRPGGQPKPPNSSDRDA